MSDVNIIKGDPTLIQNLKAHRKPITEISFHPNGNQLTSSSLDNSVGFWDLSALQKKCYKLMGHSDGVTCVQFASSGRLVASGSKDQSVRLWVPSITRPSAQFKAHSAAICSVSFAPDCKQLVTGSNDKSIKIWDVQKRHFISSFTGHNNWVCCVRYCSDGNCIFSCGEDKSVRVWDTRSGQCVHVFTYSKASGNHLAVHSSNKYIAVAMSNGAIRIYDIQAKKLKQHYSLLDNATCVAWHPFATYLLASGCSGVDGTMEIIDIMEGRSLYTLKGHQGNISSTIFTDDGSKFASAGVDGYIKIWKTNFIS